MLSELQQDQVEQVLRSEVIGRIGCSSAERTYVVPVSYVYDGESIYGHSRDGMKLQMMRANPEVCFEVEQIANIGYWRSVIAWGTFEELAGDEAKQVLQMLTHRFASLIMKEHGTSSQATQSDTVRSLTEPDQQVVVYRIRLKEKTGRIEMS